MGNLASTYRATQITLDEYKSMWRRTRHRLPRQCLFVTPFWLETVVKHLGAEGDPRVVVVTRRQEAVGVVPLACRDNSASFLGKADVCDYQDGIIRPGHEAAVGQVLIDHLAGHGIRRLDLQALRPGAAIAKALRPLKEKKQFRIIQHPCDVTYEATLPADWGAYMMQLNGKQRHEVRRKLRRLASHGDFTYRLADWQHDLKRATARFLTLFHLNRTDKAAFMDHTMSAYFTALIEQLAQQQMLRLYFLDVGSRPAAAVLCFDYNGTRYLYNSGYDAHFHHLSVGILSKVLSIREGIAAGCGVYDFLKGSEVYKKHIGGREVPLYRYLVTF
jgi:CelD/BcsL family acetyltransferase involved in cellulose biosynthesis